LRNFIKTSGFVLIAVGTIGLLLNEFVWNTSSSRTIIFAVATFVGFVNLAFAHFGMKKSNID
jgi:O-antigen ligase